ncbi:MAG: aspartate ammonia-lyase, partial [Candidatus Zixiibacteriota bacterium]
MTSINIYDFISKIELFKDLTEEEQHLLTESIEIADYEPGALLFEENSPRRNVYLVYDGGIELFKTTPFGEEKRLLCFDRHSFLGEGTLMDDYPHSTSARALIQSKLLIISRDSFALLSESQPQIAMKILSRVARVISRRLRQTSTQMVSAAAQYVSGRTRQEHDLLGERDVPDEFYYGIQTLRALENFPISNVSLNHFSVLIEAMAMVKLAAAKANYDLGLLDKEIADAIISACRDILGGQLHTHFVVDMIQGGAGTS